MFTLNCKGRMLVVDKPLVMGIINTTPDSFYAGSRYQGGDIVQQAGQILAEGAAILDIGGQSTRPGSERISATEEIVRIKEPIRAIKATFPDAIISIDTYYARVAAEAVEAGASIVNDISAGSMDGSMISTVARLRVPYVLMHMLGTPDTMQVAPVYGQVTRDVLDFFIKQVAACRNAGMEDIILDPGIGFGKTDQHNLRLIKDLAVFNMLDCPLLLGVSRKGTINRTLGVKAADALNGTTVLNTIGLMNGAHILRVHDVREAVEAVKMWTAYKEA